MVDEIVAEAEVSGPPVVDSPVESAAGGTAGSLGAELESLRSELDERTRDLQRVTAEYANYRKRVDRDRRPGPGAGDRTGCSPRCCRSSTTWTGPASTATWWARSAAMAEQLNAALGKFGLTAFGEQGDPFDPTRHEAVAAPDLARRHRADLRARSCAGATSSATGCCGRPWSR